MVDFRLNSYNPNMYIGKSSMSNREQKTNDVSFRGMTSPIAQNESYLQNSLEVQAAQNIPFINTVSQLDKNIEIGKSVVADFNSKYPNIESSSMLDVLAMQLRDISPVKADEIQKYADEATDKYVTMADNHMVSENFSDEQYIQQIKSDIEKYNMANCGERAYLIQDELNKQGIDNKIIQIDGDKNFESHVFNIIGVSKDFDVKNPQTWGENAVVIDSWSNKVLTPDKAIKYYADLLGYNKYNHQMSFTEVCLKDVRENTLQDAKNRYEEKVQREVSMEELGNLTYKEIFAK